MEFIIIGIAVVFNIVILRAKFSRQRYLDAFTDITILAILTIIFSGTYGGMVVATVASTCISLYLLAYPPKLKGIHVNN